MSIDIYTGILKMFDAFESSTVNGFHFFYDFENDHLAELNEKYRLSVIAGHGNDLTKAINLLHWVSENIYHKGNYDGRIPNNSIALLNYSYQEGQDRGINCRSLSTVLTECCLSVGIHARTIHIMPCSPYDGDNHVITSVYSKESQNWVMLDPTYDCYLFSNAGNALGIFELRKMLSNKDHVQFNDEVNYNGQKHEHIHEKILEYYSKNLFYFWCREHNTFGSDDGKGGKMVVCTPSGYNMQKAKEVNLSWRMCQCGDNEYMSIWKNEINEKKIYVSVKDFMSTPIPTGLSIL